MSQGRRHIVAVSRTACYFDVVIMYGPRYLNLINEKKKKKEKLSQKVNVVCKLLRICLLTAILKL